MSSQTSRVTRSRIGATYLTRDGLVTGAPLVVLFETDDWSPLRNNGGDVIAGEEFQQVNIGGASGKKNWPVRLLIRGVWDVVWAALFAQRSTEGATFDASFALAATDAAGAERVLTFSALRWVELTHASAPDYNNRFAARIYRDVRAHLHSEA